MPALLLDNGTGVQLLSEFGPVERGSYLIVSFAGNASYGAMRAAAESMIQIEQERAEPAGVKWVGPALASINAAEAQRRLALAAGNATQYTFGVYVMTTGVLGTAFRAPGAFIGDAARATGTAVGGAARSIGSIGGELAGGLGSAAAGGIAAGLGIPTWAIVVLVIVAALIALVIGAKTLKGALR